MVDILLEKTPQIVQNIKKKLQSFFIVEIFYGKRLQYTAKRRLHQRMWYNAEEFYRLEILWTWGEKTPTNHKNTKLLDIPKIATGRMSEDDESGATKILSSDETLLEANEAIKKKLMKKHYPPHSATALPDPPTLIILILLHCWRIYIRASIKSFKKVLPQVMTASEPNIYKISATWL